MNNNCNAAACYGPFRTSFDRMMQTKFSPFCQPSSQLVCNAAGNTVLDAKGSAVEAFQVRRAHMARAHAIRRARAAARHRKSREGFEGPDPKVPVVPPKPKPKPNGGGGGGNGKKTAKLGLADWCGFCNKLKSQLPQVKQMLADAGIEIEMVEDKADLDKLMKENNQNGFPFAVLVDENGVVVDSFGGFMPAEPYVARVKKGLKM
jgi:thiol-disulfide isomerase/thioredoxin